MYVFADIDVHSGVVQTQAGVVLEKLDAQLGEHGLKFFLGFIKICLLWIHFESTIFKMIFHLLVKFATSQMDFDAKKVPSSKILLQTLSINFEK